jgi:hypothetical protein
MSRLLKVCFILLVGLQVYGQFVNNGATVTIQQGATLRVETSFINNTGTVTNNGTLEVQDAFDNSATFFSGSSSTVRFIGTSNSNVKTNAAVLREVEMSKTASTITLLDQMTVSDTVNFVNDNNKILLGNFDFKLNGNAKVISPDANEYFVTGGGMTGKLVKAIGSNGTYTMEVGDESFYSPITAAVTAASYGLSSTIDARTTNAVHPDKPATVTPYLTRYWNVNVDGTTGAFSNVLTGSYNEADDLVGTEASLSGAVFNTPNWTFTAGAVNATANTVTSSTTVPSVAFTGMKTFINLNLTAYIEGFMNGSVMRPVLSNSGVGSSTTNCDNITVELRNATAPYAVAGTYTGIIGTNGTMRAAFTTVPPGNYYIALKHRNALETWSAAAVSIVNNGTYDFSIAVTQAYGDNMKVVNGKATLYSGDINADGVIDNIDYPIWETDYFTSAEGYYPSDLNGDGVVDNIDYPFWEINYFNSVETLKP